MGGGGGGAGGERQSDERERDLKEESAQAMMRWIKSKDPRPKRERTLLQKLGQSVVSAIVTSAISQMMLGPLMEASGMNEAQRNRQRKDAAAKKAIASTLDYYRDLSPKDKEIWDSFIDSGVYEQIRDRIQTATGTKLPSKLAVQLWWNPEGTGPSTKIPDNPPPQTATSKTPKPRRPRNTSRKPLT